MLTKENFTYQHIMDLKNNTKRDPALLEKAIYAFGLLEALRRVELPFVFKGETSLLLILKKPGRLSTDIDIIVEPGIKVDDYLEKAAQIFPFKSYEEQVRKGKNNIEKRHFKFYFESTRDGTTVEIILDILFENCKYEHIVEKDIVCDLLLTEPEYLSVKVPDVNCILADKLTAFAPHTTGILLNTGKDMEVIKQMYDVYTLINSFTDFETVCSTYKRVVADEIAYRGSDISEEDVLMDTYQSSLCVASRGIAGKEDYPSYLKGIRSLTGHIYDVNFSAEIASSYASEIMYMTACMLTKTPFVRVNNPEAYLCRQHNNKQVAKALKSLRKRDPIAFAYTVKADELICMKQ